MYFKEKKINFKIGEKILRWTVEKIISYDSKDTWKDNEPPFGFFDGRGNRYALSYDEHWIGQYEGAGKLAWTAGKQIEVKGDRHILVDLENPHYITDMDEEHILVSSHGNNYIYKLNPQKLSYTVFIDGKSHGIKALGNCVFDVNHDLWVNDITGCRLFQFTENGQLKNIIGSVEPGFNLETVSYSEARFNWIYDIRRDARGNICVLDSKNFAIRRVNVLTKTIETLAGNGKPGYDGDGKNAKFATFGSNQNEYFDGPWALSIDEDNNIFIGDTQNHVVRMIDSRDHNIYTIAGNPLVKKSIKNDVYEVDPKKVSLFKICSMDYCDGKLYIPEWDGDLIILKKLIR